MSTDPTSSLGPALVELNKVEYDKNAGPLTWTSLSTSAKVYVLSVVTAGTAALIAWFPTSIPDPALFALLLVVSCLTSLWKINLPIPLASSSTLSVSYAANLMALLLLGPQQALVIALGGVWIQCTINVRARYPWYRTAFSIGAEALTMLATALAYQRLGGEFQPVVLQTLAKPLVAAIAAYFFVNTGLIAGAIALTSGRTIREVWMQDFAWSGASFMVAGSAGAAAAVVISRGEQWPAIVLLAPVYLTYKTYQVFVGRLQDRDRHASEARQLHFETTNALSKAQDAEKALALEKDLLADTVAELRRLEKGRKELLERERTARANAEEGNRLKDQFLATVSHELRTPLNAILGWADMLRLPAIDSGTRDRASKSIYDNARQQARIIDELLDVARIVSGKLLLERSEVDLERIVRASTEIVEAAAEARHVEIVVDADESNEIVYGDASRLQQIVWNLLSNAVKFSEEAGRVVVRLRRANSIAELTVTDDGIGIPAEFLPWVFEPFRQADASNTRRHGGLGLGLSIVKHLTEAHGGSINASSEGPTHGATFVVRLPTRPSADRGPSSERSAARPDSPESLNGLSVLVLDDDRESLAVASAHLKSRLATVWLAESSPQAIEILQREHIDVILADIAMPGEDGYTFIKRVRALNVKASTTPAAALTALVREEDRQRALHSGFQLHLPKPIDRDSLIGVVARLARLSRLSTSGNPPS